MRRLYFYLYASGAAALFLGLLILAGCGGGNGPVNPAPNPPSSPSEAFLQLLPPAQRSATAVGSQKCGTCHNSKLTGLMHTKHSQVNVGCESCHGPGSAHAAAPSSTNILTFTNAVSPEVCGQCHGPLHDDYENSAHATPVTDAVQGASTTDRKSVV